MQAWMKNPAMMVPEAMQALLTLNASSERGGVPARTLGLVHLRASQINGCSVCVDMHPRLLKKAGETDQRLFAVAAWRDAPYFTEAERAALALTEAATRATGRTRYRTRSGTRPPGTTTSRRLRPWSSRSRRSTCGTDSMWRPGRWRGSGVTERQVSPRRHEGHEGHEAIHRSPQQTEIEDSPEQKEEQGNKQ
jgi:AhpD family alkylhydroperoxidase